MDKAATVDVAAPLLDAAGAQALPLRHDVRLGGRAGGAGVLEVLPAEGLEHAVQGGLCQAHEPVLWGDPRWSCGRCFDLFEGMIRYKSRAFCFGAGRGQGGEDTVRSVYVEGSVGLGLA
jgi:hypothetical protein